MTEDTPKSASIVIFDRSGVRPLWIGLGSLVDGKPVYDYSPHLELLYRKAAIRRSKPVKSVTINSFRVAASMPEWRGWEVELDTLEVGDVMHIDDEGNIVLVKFIDTVDIKSMIFNSSLFQLCVQMLEVTPWSYIIILGQLEAIPATKGAVITMQEMGVTVYSTNLGIWDETYYILNRDRKPVRADPKRDYVTATDSEAVLMSFPGIGPSKVALLLEECGTVSWAISALTDPNYEIPTITKKMKDRIREAMGLDDGSMMSPVPIENTIGVE